MAIFLSPSTKQFNKDSINFGCMLNVVRQIGGQESALNNGCQWIIDNGQYTESWTWKLWWSWLIKLILYRNTCLGIPIPDKVGNYILTLHLFRVFYQIPKSLGYPVALCTQDGMTPEMIPWQDVDCLFIGGSNNHKRGKEAQDLIFEAKRLGKWVHVGRVQSGSAMLKHWPQADSFDGTTLIRHPNQQEQSIINGVSRINEGQVPFNLKMF